MTAKARTHLCAYNFAETLDDVRRPDFRDFLSDTDDVYAQAKAVKGYLGSALNEVPAQRGTFFDQDWGRWGQFKVPWNYAGPRDYDIRYAVALSCWTDVEALRTFTYSEAHLGALRKRKRWFRKTDRPSHVLWLSTDWPTWETACARIESLDRDGVSNNAFTLHSAISRET